MTNPGMNVATGEMPVVRTGIVVLGAGDTGLGVIERVSKIAKVTLVDLDSDPATLAESLGELWDDIRYLRGDGTSVLVQREAGVERAAALVATTSSDDANIEAARLAVLMGVPEVICRVSDAARAHEAMAAGAKPVTGPMAMSGALSTRIPGVVVTTSEVGLGEGEIVQVRVMPGSLVIGRPLASIATRAFLVAAIYRDGELIVPHGDTTVEAGDQVLLVGEPETLRAVADYFRLGGAQFPRQFGRSIVAWTPSGHESVEHEANWLATATKCHRLYVVREQGETSASESAEALHLGDEPLARLGNIHPGVVVLEPPQGGLLGRVVVAPLRALLKTRVPLLLSRGTAPYQRILVPVSDTESAWRGLDVAVDIARQMHAHIMALHVRQPQFLSGDAGVERTQRIVDQVEHVARLYGVPLETRVEEGNPIRVASAVAADHDLVVLSHRRGQVNTYFNPDVGLRIALEVPSSALLLALH